MISIIIIILSSRSIYKKEFKNLQTKNLYYDDINTGDLLFVHYNIRNVFQSLTCPRFGHICLCSNEGSNKFIYEYSNYFEGKYYGFLKLPFSEWLKYNKNNNIFINKLHIKNEKKYDRKEISFKFNLYKRNNVSYNILNFKKYYKDYLNTYNYKSNSLKPPKRENAIPCYQLIIHMLSDVGIIESPKFNIENMKPDDMVYMNNFNLNPRFSYNEGYMTNINSLKFISD